MVKDRHCAGKVWLAVLSGPFAETRSPLQYLLEMKRAKSLSDWMSNARSNLDQASSDSVPTTTVSRMRQSMSRKKKAPSRIKKKQGTEAEKKEHLASSEHASHMPWVKKYQPKVLNDLAVHKKKVSEVQQWLEFAHSGRARHLPMLLLTGPPGCGKTACLQALANEMGFSILEWVNPESDGGRRVLEDARPGDQILFQDSQFKQFQNFIVRANRYPSLALAGCVAPEETLARHAKSKIVLIEEYPNAFLRDPELFYRAIESTKGGVHYPLVFTSSESHHSGSSASTIFRKDRLSRLDIFTVNFNPVTPTSVLKTLQKIATSESQLHKLSGGSNFHMPPREVLEMLAHSSNGDIRNAINSLQVICLRDSSDLCTASSQFPAKLKKSSSKSSSSLGSSKSTSSSESKSKKRKGSASSDGKTDHVTGIGGRDCSLFLFRALGKILYSKRDEDVGVVHTLPSHLKDHERSPLLVSPEDVVENSHLSADIFVLYLHQNFIEFFNDMDDISNVLGYLSDSDLLGHLWSDSKDVKQSLERYSSSVACRGLMHSNRSTPPGKWRPLHKPGWTSIHKELYLLACIAESLSYLNQDLSIQLRDNKNMCRAAFQRPCSSSHAHMWVPTDLLTELLPYMALLNATLKSPDQVAFLQSVVHFRTSLPRHMDLCLGEKDVEIRHFSLSGTVDCMDLGHQSLDCSQQTYERLSQTASLSESESCQNSTDDLIEDFEDDCVW